MSRIILISDTHHGGGPDGYRLQPCNIDRLPELYAALTGWIRQTGGADLVLHAGDAVERAEPDLIAEAVAQLDALPVPVRLALGNHDLTRPDALALWRRSAGQLLPAGQPAYAVHCDDCCVHVLPTHWGDPPFSWAGDSPRAACAEADLVATEMRIRESPCAVHLLVCHAAPGGIPADQLGGEQERDAPPAAYVDQLAGLVERNPTVRLILSGHSHANTVGALGTAHWATVSSFSESPFEVMDLRVTAKGLRMYTVPLFARLAWRARYDWGSAWVQGRACDRALEMCW